MLRQALEPQMVSYNAAISACERGQELRWALGVGAEMQRHVAPNKVNYITLNCVSVKFQDTRRAVDVCAVMMRHALQPNIVSCKALISASENGQELRRAVDVGAERPRQAPEPNKVSYNAVISAAKGPGVA